MTPKAKPAKNFHESYRASEEVVGGSDKAFGLTVGGILVGIALLKLVLAGTASWLTWTFLAIGIPLVVLGFVAPRTLTPLNRAWTALGLLLFRVVNPVVMMLIFALTVVPIGVIMRLSGKDPLRLRLDRGASSYWILREPPGPRPDTMPNQF